MYLCYDCKHTFEEPCPFEDEEYDNMEEESYPITVFVCPDCHSSNIEELDYE